MTDTGDVPDIAKIEKRPLAGVIRALDVAIFAAAVAIPLFVAVAVYYKITALWLILGLFGMGFFLPLGALVGWWIWDPYKRAQILRWIRRRNYGVVNLVHKSSGHMLPLVRDLNEDILVKDTAMWYLRGGKIYRMDKQKEVAEIKPEHITYVGGVPTIFVSMSEKKPLTFKGHNAPEATPQEVGAAILGYVYNQMTKAIASLKRQWNWMLIGMLVASLINLGLNYSTMGKIDKLEARIAAISSTPPPPVQVTPALPAETNAPSPQQTPPVPADTGIQVGGGSGGG